MARFDVRQTAENLTADPLLSDPEQGTFAPVNLGIIGGGDFCGNLLKLINNKPSSLEINVLAVCDADPESPALASAGQLNIFTCVSLEKLLAVNGLNTIVDLTGSRENWENLIKMSPPGCSIFNLTGAGLLVKFIEAEIAKDNLIRENKDKSQRLKKDQIILDALPYRIMIINPDMTVDDVNQTFIDETGFSREEIKTRHCYEIRYGLDRPCSKAGRVCYMDEGRKNRGVFNALHEYEDKNKAKHFDFITCTPIVNDRGEVVQLLEASLEMTDRIKWEQEAQQSSTFLQNVIRSTVDGIVVVDTKGKVLLFNEGMERLTGYSARELVGQGHLSNFYDMETARENMRKMRSDQYGPPGMLNPTSMYVETKDGQKIPVTLSASIIEVEGEEIGSVGVFTDMREIEKMRKELDEAHLQLVQSEKIGSVGRMAAGVAHEINNPLSIILMYAELLEQTLANVPRALPDLRVIVEQTLRSKQIVADLLEFSRKSLGEAAFFSLGQLIEQCLQLLINMAIFQDIEVTREIEPGMPEIRGDVGQLEQVFTNLFNNAADAMEGHGRLDIKAGYDSLEDSFRITIADTGPGIPERNRDKIFDVFFTTKRVGHGTGLGLSLSKNIIEMHSGNIKFECPAEGGTVFIIDLPRVGIEQSEDDPVFIGMDEI